VFQQRFISLHHHFMLLTGKYFLECVCQAPWKKSFGNARGGPLA
jgi:hypothetical protein